MILGINDGHDAGVAFVAPDGEILFAANEERYTGEKQQWGFPTRSLEKGLSFLHLDPADVTDVAFGFRGLVETQESSLLFSPRVGLTRSLYTLATKLVGPVTEIGLASDLIQAAAYLGRRNRAEIRRRLAETGFRVEPVFLRHHHAHAASAYCTSGFGSACVVTIDAGGDGISGSLWHGQGKDLRLLKTIPRIHSLGDFWLAVTMLCGFLPDRHGGKITGLAAYTPSPDALAALGTMYETVPGQFQVRNRGYLFWKRLVDGMRTVMAPFNREEIAWAAQRLLEEMVLHLVREGLRATGEKNLAVAGGVFANVRMNMELLSLPEVAGFFVHAHMGDGGTALGAALAVAADKYRAGPRTLAHAFLGSDAQPAPAARLPDGFSQEAGRMEALARRTARLLKDGRIVGVVRGRMEYGPRALTNRSILFHPFDPTVMDWLNTRLDRTEFMPFAPVLREDDAAPWFDMAAKGALSARFMTVCLPATRKARTEAPAIVHVDGTARPQFATPGEAPFICRVLTEFGKLTGVPVLINTSFNRHEHPIVATAAQGLEELARGVVDALVLDDRIIQPEKQA